MLRIVLAIKLMKQFIVYYKATWRTFSAQSGKRKGFLYFEPFFIFCSMKRSASSIKKVIYIYKLLYFLIFWETEPPKKFSIFQDPETFKRFLYFQKWKPAILSRTSKK